MQYALLTSLMSIRSLLSPTASLFIWNDQLYHTIILRNLRKWIANTSELYRHRCCIDELSRMMFLEIVELWCWSTIPQDKNSITERFSISFPPHWSAEIGRSGSQLHSIRTIKSCRCKRASFHPSRETDCSENVPAGRTRSQHRPNESRAHSK